MGCGSWDRYCRGNETPVHEVCVDRFWIGKYEVTQGEWKQVMGKNPSHFKEGDKYPVEKVSWHDASVFIDKLSSMNQGLYHFRLPREAEWEYACRSGGKPEKYAGGSHAERVAWYENNSGSSTHPVGTKGPNGLDIYDMSGNVWEWCEDIYAEDAYNKHHRKNPVYTDVGPIRVYRGGGWPYDEWDIRCATRPHNRPGYRYRDVGFRLLRTK